MDDATGAEVDQDLPVEDRSAARGRRAGARVETAAPAPARIRNAQGSSLLAARAAEEYSYVARDVRHIGVVGGGLFGALLILYVLIDVLHVITI